MQVYIYILKKKRLQKIKCFKILSGEKSHEIYINRLYCQNMK